ncbi:MAG TPA: type 1 glutamine amidotransferase family protein [Acidobacteriaceae bacterium]|nr:type 1 glutamine amidotransferase family protein [Acidobacteriaceae bacterium]
MEAQTVYLYVFDGMADWEPAFAIAGINNPRFQRQPGRFCVATVASSRETITTMGGIHIEPDLALDDLFPTSSALLILPGGDAWERGGNRDAVEKVAEFLAVGVPVAAICAATLALARAGFLDNRLHTSNSPEYLKATRYRGHSLYRNIPAIADGNLITASGAAPIDFAYQIFGMLEVYSEEALNAWYALFRYGDASKFEALADAVAQHS